MRKLLLFIVIAIIITPALLLYPKSWKRLVDKATYDISANMQNYYTIVAGGEGRVVFRSFDGGVNWDTSIVGYLGGSALLNNVILHPIDTNAIICGGLNFGDIRRTEHQGNTPDDWKIVLSRTRPVALNGKALMLKPDDYNTLYLTDYMSGIWYRSRDMGKTWDSITTVKEMVQMLDSSGHLVDSLVNVLEGCNAIRQDSTNIVFVGTTNGKIFMSKDGGVNWNYITFLTQPQIIQGDCEITRMVFSKHNPLVGYACITYLNLGNTPNGGLYKTTDGGYSWSLKAFADTSIWALDIRTNSKGDNDDVFIGGYTETYWVHESFWVPGLGVVRGSTDGGDTWTNYDAEMDWAVEKPRIINSLRSTARLSDDTIIAVGNKGDIIMTYNATSWGPTWYPNDFPTSATLNCIKFINKTTGYICGNNGTILKTTDRAVTWTQKTSGFNNDLNSLAVIDPFNIVTCGSEGVIYKSTSGGSNWELQNSNTENSLYSVIFLDTQTGFASGEQGTLLKTTDAGNNWSIINSGITDTIYSVCFPDSQTGYACCSSGKVIKSTDGGNSWFDVSPAQHNFSLYSISFFDTLKGYACGSKGIFIKTTDGGASWSSIDLNTPRNCYSVQVFGTNRALVSLDLESVVEINETDTTSWQDLKWGWRTRPNCWSLRFLGQPGKERLFLGTEAGLFVNDDIIASVDELYQNDNSGMRVYQSGDNELTILYRHLNNDFSTSLDFTLYSLLGEPVLHNVFSGSNTEIAREILRIPNLPSGSYLCRIIEKGRQSSKLIIIE